MATQLGFADLIRVLCVNIVFDGVDAPLGEVFWGDLHQV